MTRLKELFTQIAQIDSESGHEKKMADFLMGYLQDMGYKPYRDSFDNIHCRVGSGPSPTLFCAHQDTVAPGNAIKVIEEDGFLVSAGDTILGGDNKVSLAAILRALEIHHEKQTPLNIELLFSVREETSSGISDFDAGRLESKVGFVFDGGGQGVDLGWCVTAAPYIDDLFIEIKGRPAHASNPENGINVLEILLDSRIDLGRVGGNTVLNIGKIRGGTAMNTIPGDLIMEGDVRSHDFKSFNQAKEDFSSRLKLSATKFRGLVSIRWDSYAIGYQHQTDTPLFNKVKEIYSQNDVEIKSIFAKTGSDAGFLNANGVTTYCLGDGVRKAHTSDESILVSDFNKLREIIGDLMVKM